MRWVTWPSVFNNERKTAATGRILLHTRCYESAQIKHFSISIRCSYQHSAAVLVNCLRRFNRMTPGNTTADAHYCAKWGVFLPAIILPDRANINGKPFFLSFRLYVNVACGNTKESEKISPRHVCKLFRFNLSAEFNKSWSPAPNWQFGSKTASGQMAKKSPLSLTSVVWRLLPESICVLRKFRFLGLKGSKPSKAKEDAPAPSAAYVVRGCQKNIMSFSRQLKANCGIL